MKDLQKQLKTERKKNEHMQDKLKELLPDDKASSLYFLVFKILFSSFVIFSHSTR